MISKKQFCAEFAELAHEAGIQGLCAIDFSERLRRRHERDPRAYAEVDVWELHFFWAPQVLSLPALHRRGLIMHEIGHVLCRQLPSGGTEDDADDAAESVFGQWIEYDRSWPGKGLQCVRVKTA